MAGGLKDSMKKKQKKVKRRDQQTKNEIKIKSDKNSSDILPATEADILPGTEADILSANSAFVQSALNKKLKQNNNTNIGSENSMKKKLKIKHLNSACSNSLDDLEGFISVGRDKGGKKYNYENLSSEECGKKAYKLILQNEKLIATDYLSKAIELDSTDTRHYINRSYCFLSSGKYRSVINDIHRIIIHTDNPKELCQLKCREGQALWGLQNYEAAAECFKESLNFMPNCAPVKCENMRMKVDELKTLGFSERTVLELLHDDPRIKIKDAVTFLCEFDVNNINDINNEDDDVDDQIFESDSEDYPSNAQLFMNLIGFGADNEDESWHEVSDCTKNSLTNNAGCDAVKFQMTNDIRVINAAATSKSSVKKSALNKSRKVY